jgi:5-formyltetrahydrofolate cyclo-ligase
MNRIGGIFPDMHGNASAKDTLRKEIGEKLRTLTLNEVRKESATIRSQLSFKPGEKVALFAGLPSEPQLLILLGQFPKTLWYLPKVIGKGTMEFLQVDSTTILQKGPFNILEPPSGKLETNFDTILCPGIAFTNEGARLGHGGGFYDRYLKSSQGTRLIGIAFKCQIVDTLPVDEHDVPMHEIVTS